MPGNPNTINGRIIHLDRTDEQPPGDIYRTLARILIWILIAIPYAILFLASGIICIAFGILRFQALSHLFNPVIWTTTIVELMEVLVLRGLRSTDTVPIYRGTIEDAQGRDQNFIMIGPLEGTALVQGRQVTLSGAWRRGTLHADLGQDAVTGSVITPRHRNRWRIIFFVMVGIYAALALSGLFMALQTTPG